MTVPDLLPTPPPDWNGVPANLRKIPRWGPWRLQMKDGRPNKVPYYGNGEANVYIPYKWLTFDVTKAACEIKGGIGYSGPRITLGKLDRIPYYLIGIDIDTCLGPDGKPSAWALALIAWACRTYAEVSPSRTGIKVFAIIGEEDLGEAKRILGIAEDKWLTTREANVEHEGAHKPGAVVFLAKRYFTVTGWRWPDAVDDVIQLRLGDLHSLATALPAWSAPNGHDVGNGVAKPRTGPKDTSRSAKAFGAAVGILKYGLASTVDELREALMAQDDAEIRDWASEVDDRQIRRLFDRARESENGHASGDVGGAGTDSVGGGGGDVGGGGHGGAGGGGDVGGGGDKPVNWLRMLTRGGRSAEPHASVGNVVVALKHAPDLMGLVAYDDMAKEAVITRPIPGSTHAHAKYPRAVEDVDATEIQIWISANGRIYKLGREAVFQAIDTVSRSNVFHPIRDYLDGLAWDGVGRLDTWLVRYCGAEDTPYVREVGRCVLLSMVERIRTPGCKCDYVMVLEGEQGAQKSQLLNAMAGGDEWFHDRLSEITDKDSSQDLRGKWLIEAADLHAFSRADVERLKAYITRRIEKYRPAYGHLGTKEPRQGILVGSTNRKAYLADDTGNRRFWPIETGVIDIEGFKAMRDQLFAEAVARRRDGEQWWPTREIEEEYFEAEQGARYEADVWEPIVLAKLAEGTPMTVAEAAINVKEVGQFTKGDQNRVTAIMERAGWERRHIRGHNGAKLWIPPGTPNPKSTKHGSRRKTHQGR